MTAGILSFGSPSNPWSVLVLGAGGYVTKLSFANDGTAYIGDDSYNCYRLDHGATKWVPLFNSNNLLAQTAAGTQYQSGVWDIVTAPTNSNIAYVVFPLIVIATQIFTHYTFKTTDRGATWVPTGFPSYVDSDNISNDAARLTTQHSAIDPANANHVLMWQISNRGLWESLDGGVTANLVGGGLPVGIAGSNLPGGCGLVFDPTSGTTTLPGGQVVTSVIYTGVWGQGAWQSSDGGQTWTQLSNPTAPPFTLSYTTALANSEITVLCVSAGALIGTPTAAGLTFTSNGSAGDGVNTHLQAFKALAATADTYSITITPNPGASSARAAAFAVNGANTSTPLDPNSPWTATQAAPTITTSIANTLVVTFLDSSATGFDAGWTNLITESAHFFFSEYQIFSSTQTGLHPTGSGGSGPFAGLAFAYQQAVGKTLALDGAPTATSASAGSTSGPLNVCSGSVNPWTTGSFLTKRYWCGERNLSINSGRTKTWRYNDDTTWTEIQKPGGGSFEAYSTCPDPATPGRIWVVGNSVAGAISTLDNGTTNPVTLGQWSGNTNTPAASGGNQWTFNNSDVPWQSITENFSGTQIAPVEFTGDSAFDPITSNKLWVTNGTGVRYYNPPSTYVAYQTNVQALGIEALVPTQGGFSVPGGFSLVGNEDRGFMVIQNPNTPPSDYVFDINNGAFNLSGGYGGDWASSDPTFIVAAVAQQGGYSGFSTNKGVSWSMFTKNPVPAFTFPSVSCASSQNCVMTILDGNAWNTGIGPAGGNLTTGIPIYTTNQGATWNTCTLVGGGALPTSGWSAGGNRRIWNDRTTIGTYWMTNTTHGLYTSTDSGVTWTLLSPTGISFKRSNDATGKGRAAPYDYSQQAGWTSDLWYAATGFVSDTLWHSTDGGNTWTSISLVTSMVDWDFGAPLTAGGFPTLFVFGTVNGHFGVSMSTDYGVTWTYLPDTRYFQQRPVGECSFGFSIVGDGVHFGRCYFGVFSSWFYYNVG